MQIKQIKAVSNDESSFKEKYFSIPGQYIPIPVQSHLQDHKQELNPVQSNVNPVHLSVVA